MKSAHIIICFIIFIFGSSFANATVGKISVYGVVDGDSLLARANRDDKGPKMKIRLWGIDSPEWDQHFSKESKKFMKKMIQGRYVKIESKGYDKYGRLLAVIYLDNSKTLNLLSIEKGYAWVHKYYCDEKICDKWLLAEDNAKKSRKGLWQNDNPVAPWIWKNKEKNYYKRDN